MSLLFLEITETRKSIFYLILILPILWHFWAFLSLLPCTLLLQKTPIYMQYPKMRLQLLQNQALDISGLLIRMKFGYYLVFSIIWAFIENLIFEFIRRR